MKNWITKKLGDCSIKFVDGDRSSRYPKRDEFVASGIPFLNAESINSGYVNLSKANFIAENKFSEIKKGRLEQNDLILTTRGNGVGKVAYFSNDKVDTGLINAQLLIVRAFGDLNAKYLYYYFSSCFFQGNIKNFVSGAAQPQIPISSLKSIEISYPILKAQQKIADILSAYDDLIENNRRRIQLLERSLHLLYKEWFVYLRFPSHEHSKIVDGIPEGWERKPLGSFITLNYGKSLQSDKRVSGNYPVYGSSGIIGTHIEPLVKGHGIIVGRKGNVGKVFWADSDYFPIDTVYFISPESSNFFLFYALLNTQFTSTDVAVPGLNRNFAHSVHILIPDKKLLEIFEDLAKPIRKQISIINKQNESLGKARDLLLPKLMSGAISV